MLIRPPLEQIRKGDEMKVYQKQLRNTEVQDYTFYCSILEKNKFVLYRIYSSEYKSTYCEFKFSWYDLHSINLNRPRVATCIINYAISLEWQYAKENQIKHIEVKDSLLMELQNIDD